MDIRSRRELSLPENAASENLELDRKSASELSERILADRQHLKAELYLRGEASEVIDVRPPIQNKIDGLAREAAAEEKLKEQYPEAQGFELLREAYLRDQSGIIVRDTATNEARRVDFMVLKDGEVVDSIEVTSPTADKTAQIAKEARIRGSGGNYVRNYRGELCRFPSECCTRIDRREVELK